ncbi:SDR family oxidoreductase [Herbiconiux liukaitaii]|uniref:SDR family oxidoreductase n=1 Tax=Herbiconiux liukaitaii TaxID=3342799 RepID=UPI0035B73B63
MSDPVDSELSAAGAELGGGMGAWPGGGVAVVTGGGSGIGLAIATRLAAEGARVAVADIDAEAARRAVEGILAGHPDAREEGVGGARVAAFQVDVSSLGSVQALAAAVRETFGPVSILVNNAGVASTGRLDAMTDEDWGWLLGVNFYGMVHGVTAFLPQLRETRGRMLNTGSMAGLSPDAGMGGYGTSKFAVTAYTEVLAAELAEEGIAVTLLAPGPVRTALGSSSRNRPEGSEGGLVDVDLAASEGGGLRWISAEEVAEVAVEALRDGRRYAITHPDWVDVVRERHRSIEAAFAEASRGSASQGHTGRIDQE